MDEFAAVFADVADPRTGNAKRHELLEILMIALCTLLSGGTSCADMALFGRAKRDFLGEFLPLRHGIPRHDTFSRVFRLLAPDPFRRCFVAFMRRFAAASREEAGVVALDGAPLLRPSGPGLAAAPGQRLGGRAAPGPGAAGGGRQVERDHRRAPAPGHARAQGHHRHRRCAQLPARHRPTGGRAGRRRRPGANQGTLHDDVRLFLDDPATPLHSATSVDGGHGRIEERRATVSMDIAWLQEHHHWPGLAAIGKVTARRESNGGTTVKTRPYLLSKAFDAARFGALVRAHWDIENRLHWVLDVALNEDQARTRKDHGPENLALLRRLALNRAQREPSTGSLRGKLKRAGWDHRFLTQLLAQFAPPQMR